MQRVRRERSERKAGRGTGSNRKVALKTADSGGTRPSQTADWRVKRQSRMRKEPTVEGTTFVGLDAHSPPARRTKPPVTFAVREKMPAKTWCVAATG